MEDTRMLREESGFTLVEIMVSLMVTLIIVAGAYAVFAVQNQSANVQNEVAAMQQNGRIAMDALVAEIRRGAYNNPEDSAGATVTIDATGSSIEIEKDVDDDGSISDTTTDTSDDEEDITLQVNSSNQLEKVIHKANGTDLHQVLADNIFSLSFSPSGASDPQTVAVTLQVRTKHEDPKWTDSAVGVNLSGTASDGLARVRTYQKTIWVRNLNLS